MEYDLNAGQEILISTGYLAAMEESCTMDVVAVKGVKNMLVGGEGIFNTVVRGPGKVILQTMPISKMCIRDRVHLMTVLNLILHMTGENLLSLSAVRV